MEYPQLEQLLNSSNTVKLMRAEQAPLVLSFLFKAFKSNNTICIAENEMIRMLEEHLFELKLDEGKYSRNAKDYLTDWADRGYLRKFLAGEDEPIFELTPSAENAFKWLEDLQQPEFVGTESRLKLLFEKLKEIASKSKKDIDGRIRELEEEKRKIEKEIEEVRRGKMDVWDDRKIKEEYHIAQENAKRLLADFRQVEQNFREIDRNFRKQIITSNQAKGEVLVDLFRQHDYLWETDQGKSFRAFWEFMLSQNMQTEFESAIEDVMELPLMDELQSQGFNISSIRNSLIEAGDKTNKTTGSLLEQLRKYLEHKAFFESKKIHENISELIRFITSHPEMDFENIPFLEIDDPVKIDLTMERPIFNPPQQMKFVRTGSEEGEPVDMSAALFEQFEISLSELNENIKKALRNKKQIAFPELIEEFEIKKGVAEVIGYVEIAAKDINHICNDSLKEEIVVYNFKSNKHFKVKIPQIIFCKS